MKLQSAIFSVTVLGLLSIPVFALGQGAGDTASLPLGSLLPSLTLPSVSNASFGVPQSFVPTSGVGPFGAVALNHQSPINQTAMKSIQSFGGASNSPGVSSNPLIPQAGTPEPGTVALLIGGLSATFLLRRRKK